jgi:hypothetical protein
MDNATSSVIREALLPITEKDGIQDVTVLFDPIVNSKNKSYSFTVVPAGIERDSIVGISIKPEPVNENKELGKLKDIVNFAPLYAGFSVTDTEKEKTRDIDYLSSADYMVFTEVVLKNNVSVLILRVYSVDNDAIIFSTEEAFNGSEDLMSKSAVLVERVASALSDKLPNITLQPTMGTSEQGVFVSWKPALDGYKARIYRSVKISGPYSMVGTSDSSSYIDHSAEPGQLYWYRIQPFNAQVNGDLSQAAPGYRKMTPKGADIQKLLAAKKLTPAAEKTAAAQKALKDEIAFIKDRYMNSVKLTVMMTFGKSYIDSGTVFVFEKMPLYSMDLRKREIYFLNDNALVTFNAKSLFRLRESAMPLPGHLIAKAEFGTAGNADNYAATGFSAPQQDLRWNDTDAPSLEFSVGKPASDLFVDMHLAPPWAEEPYTCKKVEVFANGTSAGSVTVTGNGRYRVTVPQELLSGDKLRLAFQVSGTVSSDKENPHPKAAFYSVSVSRKFLKNDLFSRLMDNGVFYCVYEHDTPVLQNDGTIKYIPQYSAVGMSTEYFKDNKAWKSETITFTTSDEELLKRVKKIKPDKK